MIGLDSNVLVRYLTQDDELQSKIATRVVDSFTAESPGYLPLVALAETVWVLKRGYRVSRSRIADIVDMLLNSSDLIIEDRPAVHFALRIYRATAADFGDALIAFSAERAGCVETVSFDKAAAEHCGMRLL